MQTIVDLQERKSKKNGDANAIYFDVQAIVKDEGLVRYTTGARLLVQIFKESELPIIDACISKDWRGLFFEGTILSAEEEEELKRKEYGLASR